MTFFDVKKCLAYNPFGDSFGEGERVFSDKIVTAAKNHIQACFNCHDTIFKGERHRARAELFEHQVTTTRWCSACCNAQALSWEDGGKLLIERYERNYF